MISGLCKFSQGEIRLHEILVDIPKTLCFHSDSNDFMSKNHQSIVFSQWLQWFQVYAIWVRRSSVLSIKSIQGGNEESLFQRRQTTIGKIRRPIWGNGKGEMNRTAGKARPLTLPGPQGAGGFMGPSLLPIILGSLHPCGRVLTETTLILPPYPLP